MGHQGGNVNLERLTNEKKDLWGSNDLKPNIRTNQRKVIREEWLG